MSFVLVAPGPEAAPSGGPVCAPQAGPGGKALLEQALPGGYISWRRAIRHPVSGCFPAVRVSRPLPKTSNRRAPMIALLNLIDTLITLYIWVIIIGVVLSWLIAFNVINTHNRFVYIAVDTINRLTEPVLRPIRNFLPNLGGLDVSPVILLLALFFAQNLIRYDIPMWLGAGRF
jgi:YggT family protein